MHRNDPREAHASVKSPHPSFLLASILTGIAAISCASIFIRLADAPPVAIATYRVTLATAAIIPYHILAHRSKPSSWDRNLALTSLVAGVFLALHFIFWISSLSYTSVASSATLASTTPIFVALFSYLLLRERPSPRLKFGVLCTVLGSALLAGQDYAFSQTTLPGNLLAVLGALMASGYLLAGRIVRERLDLSTYTLAAYGSASLTLLTVSFLLNIPLSGFSEKTYSFLVLIALVPQLIGHTAFNWALKFLSPTRVSVLILGEPIGATTLAYLVLGETLSTGKCLGLAVLASGILLSSPAHAPDGREPALTGD